MAITNGYATLAELKSKSLLDLETSEKDSLIESVIETASRAIDNACHRFFFSASQVRYYTPVHPDWLLVDDIAATSGFGIDVDEDNDGVYEVTWASTDYVLAPYNALTDGKPYTTIERATSGEHSFPLTINRSVKVTASFGWAATPKPIKDACKLQAHRLFKRFATPLGQAAATTVGEVKLDIPNLDPDILQLIKPYIRERHL